MSDSLFRLLPAVIVSEHTLSLLGACPVPLRSLVGYPKYTHKDFEHRHSHKGLIIPQGAVLAINTGE